MVLARWQFDLHNIHFDRSAGWALAIVINALLLILLSLPLRQPLVGTAPSAEPKPIDWIELTPAPPAVPAPPPPQAPARQRAVLSEVLRSEAPPLERAELVALPPAFDNDATPADAAAAEHALSAQHAPAESGQTGASIDYDFAPPPEYPRAELQRGVEGTVLLRVEVDPNGRVLRVEIEQSSGHRRLDRAAQQQVARHWRFRPALHDGRPVAGWVRIPIDFSLRGSQG